MSDEEKRQLIRDWCEYVAERDHQATNSEVTERYIDDFLDT